MTSLPPDVDADCSTELLSLITSGRQIYDVTRHHSVKRFKVDNAQYFSLTTPDLEAIEGNHKEKA